MRHHRVLALLGAVALGATGSAGALSASAAPVAGSSAQQQATTQQATTPPAKTTPSGKIVVLAKKGASVDDVAARVKKAGGKVESVNRDIGMISVDSSDDDFAAKARPRAGVDPAAAESAAASTATSPKPSSTEGSTTTSAARISGYGLARAPSSTTRSRTPS